MRIFIIHRCNRDRISPGPKDKVILLDGDAGPAKYPSLADLYQDFCKVTGKSRHGYNARFVQEWAFTRFGGKPSVAEEMVYQGHTLWHHMEFFFLGDVGQLGGELSFPGITFHIDLFDRLLESQKPRQVFIQDGNTVLDRIVMRLCHKHGITCSRLGLRSGKDISLSTTLTNNPALIRPYLKSRILLRRLVASTFSRRFAREDLLILTNDRYSNAANRTDHYWGPVIDELDRRRLKYKVVECDRIDSVKSLRSIKRRYVPQRYDAQFAGTYYDKECLRESRDIVRFMRERYHALLAREAFKKSFSYKGIDFFDLMRTRLDKVFLTYSIYIADVVALSRAIVRQERPKVILVDHEKNYFGRSLIMEGHDRGAATIAFEAEAVYDNNTYLTQANVPGVLDSRSPLWRPIPTKKLMWGEHSFDWFKEKSLFPPTNMKIIGAPKYDFLSKLSRKDRDEIRKRYSIPEGHKVIVVFTAEVWSQETEFLSTIFRAFSGLPDCSVIVKTHPLDKPTHKREIEQLSDSLHCRAHVVEWENCSKLIYASDLVLSCASTLAFECVLLDKKTIIYGYETDKEQPYIREQAVELCTGPADLGKAMHRLLLLSGPSRLGERQKFIRKYLFSDDGHSSARAIDEVVALLAKTGSGQTKNRPPRGIKNQKIGKEASQ